MQLDNQRRIIWTPGAEDLGKKTVEIKVLDGRGGIVNQIYDLEVKNFTDFRLQSPKITSTPNTRAAIGNQYRYTPTVNNPDNDFLVFALDKSPVGMVIAPATGTLVWTPTSDQNKSQDIALTVIGRRSGSYTQNYTLSVNGMNTPPQILSNPVTNTTVGRVYRYKVAVSDIDGDRLTYSLAKSPAGMKIDPDSGLIEWTPPTSNWFDVSVKVEDGNGGIVTQDYRLGIGTSIVDTPPQITSTPITKSAVGQPYQYQVTGIDPTGTAPVRYYFYNYPPNNMTINSDTGLITWNPSVSDVGFRDIIIAAYSSYGIAYQTFKLSTINNTAAVINSTPRATVTAGATYSYDVVAVDADNDALSYSLVNPPLGMSIDKFGKITWIPGVSDIGNKSIQIAVNDGRQSPLVQNYNLAVVADNEVPKVNLVASKNFVDKGEKVTFQVSASDSTPNTLSDNPRSSSKYDSLGIQTDSIDPKGRVTSYKYDSLSRLTETIYPDNTPNNLSDNPTTKTEYDKLGRKVAGIDQNGKVTRYEYDEIGQLTDVVQVLDASVEVRTEYEYDEANRLVWIEDANDHKTKYEYDQNGRRSVVELPLGKKSFTTYDAVGNVYTTTDFNGDSISYQYDEQNRLIKKEFSSASGQVPVTFFYTLTGQIDKIVDGRGTTSFKYDERNRLISRTNPSGVYLASGNTIEYGYDVAGNRTSVRTPNEFVTYSYDEQNRLKTVTSSQGTTTYFYDVAGNLVKTELPNGVVETRDYDELNRLKLVKNSKDGVVISSFDYSLDLVGHRRVVQEQNGRKVEYEYDGLYRLTKETITDAVAGNRIVEYTYDKVGNRLTKNDSVEGVTTYTYDDNDRLKTEVLRRNGVVVQAVEYRYDDNGNLKSRIKNGVEEVSYTWDKENRLIGVSQASGEVISYQYDSDGIRVSSTVNGVKTEFLVDKNLPYAQVLEERVNNGLTAGYVYGNDLILMQRGSEKSFYLVDGLGSTRGLTNANGNVTDTYAYDAFGNLISSTNNVQNNYLFAGEQFDKSLGDYYLRARYYDTDTGRFTKRDDYEGDIYNTISLHKYLYANANPVNLTDPSGFIAIPGSDELNVILLIQAILLTLITTTITSDTVQEEICRYTIDENHIFFPQVRGGRITGFHSTARANEEIQGEGDYYWVNEPDWDAEFEPFRAEFRIPGRRNLGTKTSSFFPMQLTDQEVLDLIGEAYVKSGCRPYSWWSAPVINRRTGQPITIQGYVQDHVIQTAYPFDGTQDY